MKMIEVREFSKDMQESVNSFFDAVFKETGKSYEPNGRHSAFADAEQNFIGFWCMYDGEEIIGTSALKKLSDMDCELKGLYLYKKYHGQKLGHYLAKMAVECAKENGFEQILLDTREVYDKAMRLYEKMGFERIERYNDNEHADVFMKMML